MCVRVFVSYSSEHQVRVEVLEDVVDGTVEVFFCGLVPLQGLLPDESLQWLTQLVHCSRPPKEQLHHVANGQ